MVYFAAQIALICTILQCQYSWRTIKFFSWDNLVKTTTIKENRLNIRCDNHARELLNKAAAYAHVSISEFVLSHALASAERLIQEHELITLQPTDFQAFLAALDEVVEPNAALSRAFNRHCEQVGR